MAEEAWEEVVAEPIAGTQAGLHSNRVQMFLFVDSGGNTFARGDPRHLAPKGWITVAALTEVTGERAALASLDAVSVELYLNRLRVNSEFSGEAVTLRQAIEGVEDLGLPAIREMLQLLQGYNIAVEGYDRFGNRYPASILLDITLTQAGLSGLNFRLYDPSEQEINEFHLFAQSILHSTNPELTGIIKLDLIREYASNLFTISRENIAFMEVAGQYFVAISSKDSAATGQGVFLDTVFLLNPLTGIKKIEAKSMQELLQGRLFQTFRVWDPRNFDSEVILFENLRQIYDLMPINQMAALRGKTIPLNLFTKLPPCRSCQFVMAQFVMYMQIQYGINFEIRVEWDRNQPNPRRQRPHGSRADYINMVPNEVLDFFWAHSDPTDDEVGFVMYSSEWWAWYAQRGSIPLYSQQWIDWEFKL